MWYKPIITEVAERDWLVYESQKVDKQRRKKWDDIAVTFIMKLLKFAWEGLWELNQWVISDEDSLDQK